MSASTRSLPPGPRGKLATTLKIVRDPKAAFSTWAKQYGDPFLVHAANGPIVVTGRPDLIKEIFGAEPDYFEPFAAKTLLPLLGAGSVLLLNGNAHRKERRMLTPLFHGERMKAYASEIQAVALRAMQEHEGGKPFATLPLTTRVSFEVIVRTIFGAHNETDVAALTDAGRLLVKRSNPLLFFSRKTHFPFLGLSPWDHFQSALKRLNAALDLEIAKCQQRSRDLSGGDILSLLVNAEYEDGSRMTSAEIRDELRTFMFAGHETSAIAMAWAMYLIHVNPRVRNRLREELSKVDMSNPLEFTTNEYLKSTIQETLRIHPIVTEVLRLLQRPFDLGEFHLPVGMGVAPAVILAHYNEELFPNPTEFRPERFIERSFSPFEYLPFGGGHRRCIGAAFANFEMAVVLGTWLKTYEFESLDRQEVVPKRRNITLGPSTEVMMRITPSQTTP